MKKFLGVILALVMVFSLSMTAMAAESSWNGSAYSNGNEANVAANYSAATTTVANVRKVDIVWTVTNGSHTVGNTQYTWDTAQHKYVAGAATGASTTNPSVTVTLTNHSDVALTADITYTDTNDAVVSSASAIEDIALETGVSVTDGNYAEATYVQPAAVVKVMDITIEDWSKITQTNEVIGKVTVTLEG